MAWIFKEKWLWIIVLSVVTIIVLPFIIILAILNLDPILRIVAVIFLVVCWGVAGAYKDWTRSKREEEEKMKK